MDLSIRDKVREQILAGYPGPLAKLDVWFSSGLGNEAARRTRS